MKTKLIVMLMMVFLIIPASGSAFDIGQAIGSAVGGLGLLADAAKTTTPGEEHYIGRAVAATIISQYPLLNNPALTKYINEVGLLLARVSERPVTYGDYHFAVLNTNIESAYACPGGLIFITKGMLKRLKNEDELAAILGHEVAHVADRDGISAIKKSRWTKLGFYAAGQVGKHYSASEVGQLVNVFQSVVSDVAKQVMEKGYSKSDEKKADTNGLKYASEVGYDPAAIIAFMEEEVKSSHDYKSGPYSSHPTAAQRLKMMQSTVSGLPPGKIEAVRTARFRGAVASLR